MHIQDEPDFGKYTKEKFEEWKGNLPGICEKAAADVLNFTMTHYNDSEFDDIAASGASFTEAFRSDAKEDEAEGDDTAPGLLTVMELVQTFRKHLRAAPVPITKSTDGGGHSAGTGTEDDALIAKLYKHIVSIRKKYAVFLAVDQSNPNTWKKGGLATQTLQRSKFVRSKGEPGKENSMVLLNAELFPSKDLFLRSNAHKELAPCPDTLKQAAQFGASARNANSVVMLGDGRNRKIRKVFEAIVEEQQPDESKQFETCMTYRIPAKGDPRFPKRKTFGALSNRETMQGMVPVPKVRMVSKSRQHFSACGEKSSYATTYTGVPIRTWERLPRLSLEDKEKICSVKMPTIDESLWEYMKSGHPLFMLEMKNVDFYVALFQDLAVTHVLDLAAGSAAAAMAAVMLHIHYEGWGMNEAHCNWLDRIMDKAMYAIIAQDDVDEEAQKIKADVVHYFNAQIEEAQDMLDCSLDEVDHDDDDDDDEDAD